MDARQQGELTDALQASPTSPQMLVLEQKGCVYVRIHDVKRED